MDGRRFDVMTRAWATGRASRRGMLAAIAGSLLAALGPRAAAATCRPVGRSCREDANCCSGLCGDKDATGRRLCACPSPLEPCRALCVDPTTDYLTDPMNCGACDHRCPRTRCQLAACEAGQCTLIPDPVAVEGRRTCDDGDPCTEDDVCQSDGSCAGTPIVCTPLDACHLAGSCDRRTGSCPDPAAPDGRACGGDRHCCGGVCCPQATDVCTRTGCCTPEAPETTCEGACGGTVTNNCGLAVDCPGIPCGPECCDGSSEVCAGESPHQLCCAEGREACFTIGEDLAADTVCCGADRVCAPTPTFEENGLGACCPAGRAGCVTVTESGNTPFFPQSACCDEGEVCGETAFPLLGACCSEGLEACASQFALGYLVGCCAAGLVCKYTLNSGACCPAELEACATDEGVGCCREGDVCDYPSVLSPVGACCQEGRQACHTPDGTVCCGEGEDCAELAPGTGIGGCCPAGRAGCVSPTGEFFCCGAGERCIDGLPGGPICCAEDRIICVTDAAAVCCDEGEVCTEMGGGSIGLGDCRAAGS